MFAGNSGNSELSPGQVKPSPRLRGWRDWFRHVVLWNERRGSNGEPWFNPETLAYEKREWVRKQAHRIQQQHPSRIYERFVVVGLAPDADVSEVARDVMRTREARKREREAGTSQPPIAPSVDPARDHTHRVPPNPSYPAQVLCSFPEDADSPVPEADLAAFCFPNGVTPSLLRRSASMSALSEVIYGFQHTVRDDMSFVILCQNAGRDGLPLYGVCCYSREMLHRPPSVTEARWPSAAKTPLARYMVAAPVCFCLLSHYPFFSLHFQVLETLMGLERLEKAAAFARELGQSGRDSDGRMLTRLRTMDASSCQEAGAAADGAQDDGAAPPRTCAADASAARGLPCHQLQHAASSYTTTRASSCTADSVVSSVSMARAAARRARDDLWLVQSRGVSSPHRCTWDRQHSSHSAGVPPAHCAPQARPADPQGGFATVAAGAAAADAVPGSPEASDQGRARSRSHSDLGTSPPAFGAGAGAGEAAAGNDEEPGHDPFSPPPHPFAAAAGMLPEEAEEQEHNELLPQEEAQEEQRQSPIHSLEQGWPERAAESAWASSTAFDEEEPPLPAALLGPAPFAFARVAASPPASPREGASLRACGTAPLPSIPSESAPPLEPLEGVYEALARCGDAAADAGQDKGDPGERGLAGGLPLDSVQSAPPSRSRATTPRQPQRFMHGAAAAISGLRRASNWRPWLKGRRLSAPEPCSSAPSLLDHDLPLAPDAVQPPSSPQPRRLLQAGRTQSLVANAWQAAGSPEGSQRYAIRSEEVRRLGDADELAGSRCGEPGLPQEPPALQKSSIQSRVHRASSSMASGLSVARSGSEADDAAALQGWGRQCAPCSSLDVLHAYSRLRIPHHGATLQFSPHPDLQEMVYQRKALEWVPGLLASAGGKAAAAGSDSGSPRCDDDEDGGELAAVTRGVPYSPLFASAEEEAALSLRAWTVAALCRCLSLDNILVLITAALLERSMVVCCSNLGLLSACVLSLIPLLRPFCWQSLMLPLLPLQPSYLQLLDAPVPFIVGVQYKTPEVRARSHGLIRVNVYKDRIKNASSLPNLPLARDLLTQLAPWHQQLSQLGRGSSKRPIHYTTRQQQQMVDGFCAVLQSQLHRLVDNLRVHTITDVQRPGERVSLLLKDSLIESWPSASRTFMRHFLETQLFSQYSDFVLE